MSSKDDMSDSTTGNSPQHSPVQRVPQTSIKDDDQSTRPFLKIIVQPQDQFRFRYRSESAGTHGCLFGRTDGTGGRTYPTVALVNYDKQARIRCRLVQNDNDKDHPHQLEEEDDCDVSVEVGDSYVVKFAGLGIIHTAKKDVPQVLFQRYSKELAPNVSAKALKTHCDKLAKSINLNIVRLKFSAHEIDTDKEICSPVYSEPIHNMKSALTNALKICRISKAYGSARGGENLFLLVEKVSKKDIAVHFVEDCPKTGKELWRSKGLFTYSDVHHQHAIVCKTPAYRNQDLDKEVPVYIELVRPSNGRTSERVSFTYKSEHVFKNKKRKYDSYSSIGSFSCDNLKITKSSTTVADPHTISPSPPSNQISTDVTIGTREHQIEHSLLPVLSQQNVPPPVNSLVQLNLNNSIDLNDRIESDEQQQIIAKEFEAFMNSDVANYVLEHFNLNDMLSPWPPSNQVSTDVEIGTREDQIVHSPSPVLLQPNVPSPINNLVQLNSNEPIGTNDHIEFNEQQETQSNVFEEPPNSCMMNCDFEHNSPNDNASYTDAYNLQDVIFINFQSDGIKEKTEEKMADSRKISITDKEKDKSDTYSSLYSEEDGTEIKKIIKEIAVLLMQAKKSKKIDESRTENVRRKLQQLMDMRLDNGDTFLHMTLCINTLQSMTFVVKLIHSLKMTSTLNLVNNKSQTVLHLAIMNNMPDYMPFLISKGCDPMIKDYQGNNAIHYAVIYKSCLSPMLCSIKSNRVNSDLDRHNDDKQTALHIAAQYGPAESVSLLLKHGAGYGVRDIDGRTPLHLAAYDGSVANIEALLAFIPANEIDVVDRNGNTPLQIVCGLQHPRSVEIARLLLDKGANPLKFDDKKKAELASVEKNLELMNLLKGYISSERNIDEETNLESEDEYESTEEDFPETGTDYLLKYINEVSAILDRSDAWRELAKRLHQDTLIDWYETLPSPTAVLLAKVKEGQENFSSESLAKILNDMGEKEAANIIYRCLN